MRFKHAPVKLTQNPAQAMLSMNATSGSFNKITHGKFNCDINVFTGAVYLKLKEDDQLKQKREKKITIHCTY